MTFKLCNSTQIHVNIKRQNYDCCATCYWTACVAAVTVELANLLEYATIAIEGPNSGEDATKVLAGAGKCKRQERHNNTSASCRQVVVNCSRTASLLTYSVLG